MKKKLHDQFSMLGSNSRRWIVSSKNSMLLLSLVALSVCFSSKVQAQEEISTERNERAATAVSGTAPDAGVSTELREVNLKANLLLNELRDLLKYAEKEAKFREGIGAPIVEKTVVLCPSVDLKHLLFGDEITNAVRFADYEEGKNFVSLLGFAINELAQ